MLDALRAKRPVVTANKQLLAQHGEELFDVAREAGVQLRFEAAVAGVIPIVRVIQESFGVTEIAKVFGIVNGTTNFILTEMAASGAPYEEVLARAQELGYAEADPTADVSGADAAAKMAILARLAFHTPVTLDEVSYEGIEQVEPDDLAYAKELGLSLKLLGVAERREGGISVRVFPCFLYGGHPLAPVEGPFNAVMVEAPEITEVTMSGPGAGGVQTASAVLGDVVSILSGDAPGARDARAPADRHRRHLLLLPPPRGRRPPRRARPGRPGARRQRRLGEERRPARQRRGRAPGDGHPRVPRVALLGGAGGDRRARRAALAAALDPGDRRGVRLSPAPLIERYRERLSLEPGDPVVTLNEGSTPLVEAPRLSERIGVRAYLKFEGANPTGSFKDRGMTVAVSRAKGRGAEAVICASTGNTAASAAAYAARAGMRGAVIVPEGKIAIGKLAQALMHGARVVALQGNFDDALRIVRELADKHPIELVNSVNPHRIEGQKTAAFEVIEELGEAPGRAGDPGRQRRQRHRLLARLPGGRHRADPLRLPGRGRRAAGPRRAGRQPRDRRLGDPDRQPGPLGGGDGRLHRLARPRRRRLRRADPRRLPLARRRRGRLLRARLGGLGRRPARPRPAHGRGRSRRRRRSSASSPATASRTPTPRSPKRRR